MFPHYGNIIVYPKKYETVKELVTIQLRNKLRKQLDNTFSYEIVTVEYIELKSIDIQRI